MLKGFNYELWDGKKCIGHFYSNYPLYGKYLVLPEASVLKHQYGRPWKEIKIPIITRHLKDDGIDYTIRRVLDIRKKSKRQIEIIKNCKSLF